MADYTNVISVGAAMITIIGIGFLCNKLKIATSKDLAPVNTFVFKCCLPMLIARSIAPRKLSELDFMPLFFSAIMAIATGIVLLFVFLLPIQDKFKYYIQTLLPSVYINYVISGVPIFEALWDPSEGTVVAMMTICNDLVVAPLFYIVVEVYKKSLNLDENGKRQPFKFKDLLPIAMRVITSPSLLGIAGGFIYAALPIGVPPFVDALLKYLGDTSVPLSLFNVGVFLANHSLMSCSFHQFLLALVSRGIIGPFFLCVLCSIFKVAPRLSRQIIIIGAQPTAVASYLISEACEIGSGTASTMIFWSSIFCVPLIIMWFSILDGLNLFIE